MAGGIKEENLSLALRYIVDNFGKNTLLNAQKVESILSDLIPKEPTEKNWAVDAINLGIVKILLDENIVDDKGRQDAIKKAQDVFKRQYVAELRMDYILDNLLYALGWSNVKVEGLKEYELKRKSKPVKKLQLKKEENKYETPISKPTVDTKKVKENVEKDNLKKSNNDNKKKKHPNPNPNPNPKPKDQSKFNTPNRNNKKLLLLLIPIIIVIFLIAKLFSGGADVRLSDFYFNKQYELQGSTYVFDKNEFVQLNITLDSNNSKEIDYDKVSYSIDDNNICYYTRDVGNKCFLTSIGEGNTVLRIYYDGKEIDSINIGFGDITGSKDASVDQIHASSNITMNGQNYILPVNEDGQIQVVLNDEDLDESKLSYTVDDSNIASVSGSGSICQIYGKNAGGTNIRILYDGKEIKTIYLEVEAEEVDNSQQSSLDSNSEVDLVVKGYLENYADAVNYGEISYVEPYLTSTGAFHKELSKTIPKNYEKGTQVDVIGYTKNSMKQESGQYRVGMTIEYYVYKQGETKYQKEYMEFIAVQRSGEWIIDRYENWKLLEQYKV